MEGAIEIDPGSEPVGEYSSLGRAQEHALVILAMNLNCWLDAEEADRYVLLADPGRVPAIEAELDAYDREQEEIRETPPPFDPPKFAAGPWLALLWVCSLMLVFILQGEDPTISERFSTSNLQMLDGGQWWRAFTAQFLHADLGHLVSNIASGTACAMLVCRSLGRLLGWASIIAGGALGNLMTAGFYYPEPFDSLGASSAVFAALGVLTTYGFYLAFRAPNSTPWRSVIAPLGGGVTLLAWFGAGGDNVDVLGHIFGFLAGCLLGFVASWWRLRPHLGKAG